MSNVFELFDLRHPSSALSARGEILDLARLRGRDLRREAEALLSDGETQAEVALRNGERIFGVHSARARDWTAAAGEAAARFFEAGAAGRLPGALRDYGRDAVERAILTADALRKRGDIFLEHEAADCPPVLIYQYETIMDGKDLPHPCNYMLLEILPPEGAAVDPKRRPYVIIDPRAGHGPGIGGFKPDSQVGVALAGGHPVYFVAFRSRPEPGQTIADVTRAEAAFLREVIRRHPEAPKPIVTGNCQGGWAALLLAALNADLTGPVVVNGAPVAPWAGVVGENPMRYAGGVRAGAWLPMFLSDVGGGIFDGAHLVANFETLNPGRTLFSKYTDLFRDIDKGDKAFLDFERWWGGFFLLNEAEIRWIVEQIFVGNRLTKNEATIESGRPIDLKAIKAPLIVFASRGDNITPPQQALSWIADTYADAQEIRIRGQRILYMVHEQVGHLGIFVSSHVAKKEHAQVASTLETIETLAPGLYEMIIETMSEENGETRFAVSFAERSLDDLRALDDGRADERPFAAVARASEIQARLYEATLRPFVRAAVTPATAEFSRALHPKRLERALASSRNPVMEAFGAIAEDLRPRRAKADPANPFLAWEKLWFESVEQGIDLWRDWRDLTQEATFFRLWSNPWARLFGRTHEERRRLKTLEELRGLPEVTAALDGIAQGGLPEAAVRMLALLAQKRGGVRRDKLERVAAILTQEAAFKDLTPEARARLIQRERLIASYEPEAALEALPALLASPEERAEALRLVGAALGEDPALAPEVQTLLGRFRALLESAPEAPQPEAPAPEAPAALSAARPDEADHTELKDI